MIMNMQMHAQYGGGANNDASKATEINGNERILKSFSGYIGSN